MPCNPRTGATTWATCSTDTEPSGAFPRCRSRFGVFDQHGNVAEIMMRRDEAGERVSQLKGSAWFYRELAREPDKPVPATTPSKDTAYPDHCDFNPRWHVEKMNAAWHSNYHLGFRCCKTVP
jgi:formylglycine-generating enzyme required for sulfatase activity